jgi:hypothetical protein
MDGGTPEASVTPDAGVADACTPGLPPSGFTSVAPGDAAGANAGLVLDGDDAPVLAYTADEAGGTSVYVVRWDRACARWGAPLQIDTSPEQVGAARNVSIAYDASNGAVGVVYQKLSAPLTQDHSYAIYFAQIAKGAASASAPEQVDDGAANVTSARTAPGIAMANGNIFVAYHEPFRNCNTSGCDAIVYRSKTGGAWSAESVAPVTDNGGAAIPKRTAVAVDSSGAPAVAFLASSASTTHVEVVFWRPRSATSATVMGADVGTDDPNLSLAFDGTKPRIAASIHLTTTWASDNEVVWFSASADGVAWTQPVALPEDNGSVFGEFVAVAVNPQGGIAVLADEGGGDGTDAFGLPKVLNTTDLTSFALKGTPKAGSPAGARFVDARYGSDAKLQATFQNVPGASIPSGLVYYREP